MPLSLLYSEQEASFVQSENNPALSPREHFSDFRSAQSVLCVVY